MTQPNLWKLGFTATTYALGNALRSGIPLLLLPILTRYLSPSDYGIVSMFHIIVDIVSLMIGLGLGIAVLRQYFELDGEAFPRYVTSVVAIMCFSFVITSLILLNSSGAISRWTALPSGWLCAVLAVSFANGLISMRTVVWQAQERAVTVSFFQILFTVIAVGGTIVLVVWYDMGWKGRVAGQIAAATVCGISAVILLWKANLLRASFSIRYAKHAMKIGIPFVPHHLAVWSMFVSDRLFVTNMVGLDETGVYTVGVQIALPIVLLQSSFSQAWSPWLLQQLKTGSRSAKITVVKTSYAYWIGILLCTGLLAILSPWIIDLLVGKEFRSAQHFVAWLAYAYAFNGMYLIVVPYLVYTEKTYVLAVIALFGSGVNLYLNYWLIQVNGPVGAAQATCISFLITFGLTWYAAHRAYPMPYLPVGAHCSQTGRNG